MFDAKGSRDLHWGDTPPKGGSIYPVDPDDKKDIRKHPLV
jgi:hypothetical protein